MARLVKNDAGLLSGSGSKPKFVRPGVYVALSAVSTGALVRLKMGMIPIVHKDYRRTFRAIHPSRNEFESSSFLQRDKGQMLFESRTRTADPSPQKRRLKQEKKGVAESSLGNARVPRIASCS
jgi:hypothetical protein